MSKIGVHFWSPSPCSPWTSAHRWSKAATPGTGSALWAELSLNIPFQEPKKTKNHDYWKLWKEELLSGAPRKVGTRRIHPQRTLPRDKFMLQKKELAFETYVTHSSLPEKIIRRNEKVPWGWLTYKPVHSSQKGKGSNPSAGKGLFSLNLCWRSL